MAGIEIDRVSKAYDKVRVLRDVSVSIPDGTFVALVGPSGCGKTTLLRSICGLEEISDGEIYIGGRQVTDLPPKDRDIAMVFQSYALYPHFDVQDNMSFSMKLAKAPLTAIAAKVKHAGAILGLLPLLDRLPRQLSGGQRQRVAMGRAIVRSPKVFLFDEPLSNLDAKLRVQMRKEIKQLHQRLRVTSVFVTHDQIEAMTLADQVIVMNAGVVEQIGAPLELYDRPVSPFVAGFIGSPAMNILDATVSAGDGPPQAVLATGDRLPLPEGIEVADGTAIHYGVRPEHFGTGPADGGLRAEVEVVEPTGFETFLYCAAAGGEICVRSTDRLAFAPGDPVGLRPDLAHVHLFDAGTSRRLN